MKAKEIKEFVKRFVMGLVVTLVCLLPTWVYVLARLCLSPEGFWQEAILLGGGVYFLGVAQLILAVLMVWLLYELWYRRTPVGFWGI